MNKKFSTIIIVLAAVSCFWERLLLGWSARAIIYISALSLAGLLAKIFYQRWGRSQEGALLSACIFMVSVTPVSGLPGLYWGIMPLIFAVSGLRTSGLKPKAKNMFLALFIAVHLAKYIITAPILDYIIPGIANLVFCYFAACGIDAILTQHDGLKDKLLKKAMNSALFLLPLLYILLIFAYSENKQIFLIVSKVFNIVGLALLFVFYLSYLLSRLVEGERIYLRLFIAVMLESLSVAYLL
jgi:hypothetical protein